ncbi:hypothetical protein FACS1894182_00990 [Bacteroidia bacterium]|nr:hypothetical protein FACS1894182_00990 [Bacteroidia bacterium]
MKKYILLCVLAVSATGFAQQKGEFTIDKFPEVSLKWTEYHADLRDKSQFVLTDNDIQREITAFTHSQKERNKSVLFLWEDLNANGIAPCNAFKNVLSDFFNAGLQGNDEFRIAVFSRETNNGDLLNFLTPFTNDKNTLENAVNNYKHNTVTVKDKPEYSDLNKAIYKGLDVLNAEPADNVKVIVVFTSGWNLTGGGAQSELAAVEQKAKEWHIPVYVMLYRIHGDKPEIVTLAGDTYGQVTRLPGETAATSDLIAFYQSFNQRHSCHDYTFVFKTDAKTDGNLHNIKLLVNNKVLLQDAFNAPQASFLQWIKEHTLLFIVSVILLLALIAVAVFFILKKMKKKEAENQEKLNQIESQRIADKNAAETKQHELETKIAREKTEAERREHEKTKQAETERLQNLMRVQNLYPRIVGNVNGETINFTITKIETTIGRAAGNDLTLKPKNVSSHHAKIVFNGSRFEIFDLGSTNGTILNGFPVQQSALKNTDMIGLGEAILTIYV